MSSNNSDSQDASGIPGYGLIDLSAKSDSDSTQLTQTEWRDEFESSRRALLVFLRSHDPYAVLAKTTAHFIVEACVQRTSDDPVRTPLIEQSAAELAQALFLTHDGPQRFAPISPGNFERFWKLLARNTSAFIHKQSEKDVGGALENYLSQRMRMHTIYYRNLFTKEDCESTLLALLNRIDAVAVATFGYRLSEVYRALLRVLSIVEARLFEFQGHIRTLMQDADRDKVQQSIAFLSRATPLAQRLWRCGGRQFEDMATLRMGGYQMSEMANSWIFTLSRSSLKAEFSNEMLAVLDRLSIRPGELSGMNLDHIYMNNPVWTRPFVSKSNGDMFVALPQMVVSFPFLIVESLIEGHKALEVAYSDARADHLESKIAEILRRAMPSAAVYQNVLWTDSDSGKVYENDVVALIGNTIFLFEAKSGRIADSARRGSSISLQKQIKTLFVEPAIQAQRLESYLLNAGRKASLRLKGNEELIDLRLDKPKNVHKFSICIEHLETITCTRHYPQSLGLISEEDPWSPVLSLGELQLLDRFLDSEISFFHYLTRRAKLEDMIAFEGDEQDLLSMYLANGFCVDKKELEGKRVTFLGADNAVRKPRTPRENRRTAELHGVHLPEFWKQVVREIYSDTNLPHRFDAIQAVLNQRPPALMEFERRIRNWKRGKGLKNDLLVCKYDVSDRKFVVAVNAMRTAPGAEEWHERGRNIASTYGEAFGATDCVVFLFLSKSKEKTYDAISFFRMARRARRNNSASSRTTIDNTRK